VNKEIAKIMAENTQSVITTELIMTSSGLKGFYQSDFTSSQSIETGVY